MHKAVKSATILVALLTCFSMTTISASADMQGVDVSSWQSPGICANIPGDFCIVKATQGVSYINPSYTTQLASAARTGKHTGVYAYATGGDPTAEADFFINTVSSYIGSSILVLDWEQGSNLAWGNGTWIRSWATHVHNRTGIWPMIYVQRSAINQIPADIRSTCGLWVAQYASTAATGYQTHPWRYGADGEAMLQYSSSGYLQGSGPLDLDIFAGDAKAWQRYSDPDHPHDDTGKIPQPAILKPIPPKQPHPSPTGCTIVAPGDTLSAIAARLGTTWDHLTGYHSGNPDIIQPGEQICLRTNPQPVYNNVYKIKAGDTLTGIATRYRKDWRQLAALNHLKNPNLLYIGQTITLGNSTQKGASHTSHIHIIRAGDTLSKIAVQYHTTWPLLARINHISHPYLIYPGQKLLLP